MEQGLKQCRAVGVKVGETKIIALLAGIMKDSNEAAVRERALKYVEDALQTVNDTGERYYEPELYRIGAELKSKALKTLDEAEQWFRRARDLAASAAERSLELRAAAGLARLLREDGRAGEGKQVLEEVVSWFGEKVGLKTLDYIEAKELLESLSPKDMRETA
jgi:predicted ATPase